VLKIVLSQHQADLRGGCMITVKSRKTTCHKFPVGAVKLGERP
jgi:hypothetical protein